MDEQSGGQETGLGGGSHLRQAKKASSDSWSRNDQEGDSGYDGNWKGGDPDGRRLALINVPRSSKVARRRVEAELSRMQG